MNILFAGGGTLGSVSPLLATAALFKEHGHALVFIGTANGPEKTLVQDYDIPFDTIRAPKFRRYLTWRHILVPFELLIGLWQAWRLLSRYKIDLIVSAGGYVALPLVWVGWLRRKPSVIHQQDLHAGLANMVMAPFAHTVTVAFEESKEAFGDKAVWVGNPVRDLTPTTNSLKLDPAYPTVMIFGGGTGAAAINDLVTPQIATFANVIHVTGTGRDSGLEAIQHPRYHRYAFLAEEMKEALNKSDIIVARAGLGTISELASLGKPSIIIPIPETHQESNTAFLQRHHAAIILNQHEQTEETFADSIEQLVLDKEAQKQYGAAIASLSKPNATQQFVDVCEAIL